MAEESYAVRTVKKLVADNIASASTSSVQAKIANRQLEIRGVQADFVKFKADGLSKTKANQSAATPAAAPSSLQ